MSEINNSQAPNFYENPGTGNYEQKEEIPKGISFQGEKTDLRYDPKASVNKAFVEKMVRAKIGEHEVAFGAKEISQVKKDLEQLYKTPTAVQKATALYPAFHGYVKKQGYENPDALALALENYAATAEFAKTAET